MKWRSLCIFLLFLFTIPQFRSLKKSEELITRWVFGLLFSFSPAAQWSSNEIGEKASRGVGDTTLSVQVLYRSFTPIGIVPDGVYVYACGFCVCLTYSACGSAALCVCVCVFTHEGLKELLSWCSTHTRGLVIQLVDSSSPTIDQFGSVRFVVYQTEGGRPLPSAIVFCMKSRSILSEK